MFREFPSPSKLIKTGTKKSQIHLANLLPISAFKVRHPPELCPRPAPAAPPPTPVLVITSAGATLIPRGHPGFLAPSLQKGTWFFPSSQRAIKGLVWLSEALDSHWPSSEVSGPASSQDKTSPRSLLGLLKGPLSPQLL